MRGARSEDIENQFAAVENFAFGNFFDFTDLRRGEVVVENDYIDFVSVGPLADFLELALADAGGRGERAAFLDGAVDHFGAGGGDQLGQFG